MTSVAAQRWESTCTETVACCLCRNPLGGLHVGLLLRAAPAKPSVVLHMAWHLREHLVELPDKQVWWVVQPGLDPFEQAALAVAATLVRDRLTQERLPFGFGPGVAFARRSGAPQLNGAAGFNCVSFVRALFAHARVALMGAPTEADLDSARRAADRVAQRALVEALRGDQSEQAALIEAEVGAPRVRAEEVAAASGAAARPVAFGAAAAAGAALAASLRRA